MPWTYYFIYYRWTNLSSSQSMRGTQTTGRWWWRGASEHGCHVERRAVATVGRGWSWRTTGATCMIQMWCYTCVLFRNVGLRCGNVTIGSPTGGDFTTLHEHSVGSWLPFLLWRSWSQTSTSNHQGLWLLLSSQPACQRGPSLITSRVPYISEWQLC